MNTPMTLTTAFLLFLVLGLPVCLVADRLPKQIDCPPDWDAYAWRCWMNRQGMGTDLNRETK